MFTFSRLSYYYLMGIFKVEKTKSYLQSLRRKHRDFANSIKQKQLWRSHKLFFIFIAITIGVLFITLFSVAWYYDGKAAPGTTVANLPVGGQNKDQIKKTIAGLIQNTRLSFTYEGKSATASSKDLGLNIDIEDIANKAVKTGSFNPIGIFFAGRHFDLTGSYSKEKVTQFVQKSFPELTTDPIDAQINFDARAGQFVVKPGAIGKSIKTKPLFNLVNELLKSPKIIHYRIETNESKPTVNDESANNTANKLNGILGTKINIFNQGRDIWLIDPVDIASFIELKPNKLIGGYEINYNKGKIKEFINSKLLSQISNQPINATAIADGNGEILATIKPGKNGQVPYNIDSVAEQIENSLIGGLSGRVELLTKDSEYKVDKTIAHDGRWIEANLSNYSVNLYAGKNIVWSTNSTSHGKADTPTITGLYKVWHKVYNQCMPNPPAKEPLCDIHYVTYWEGRGYAFHEAWWLNGSNVNQGISHGCINMYKNEAKMVYDWASIGTPVWVHW